MITDIKEKLADMQAKYIDKQSAEDTLKKVDNRKGRRSYAFIISFACSSF